MRNFTFMLPCIVIDLFSNNQPEAPIIQIYSVIKLYMFRASPMLIIRNFLLKTPTNLPPTVSSHSSCVPTGHHELS